MAKNDINLTAYIEDRDRVLANIETITLEQVVAYCNRWKLPMPYPLFTKEEWVKGSLHKARLGLWKLTGVSDEEFKELQKKSREYLDKLGWSYDIR